MTSFSQVYSIQNLRRAYRWLLSNPDGRYKNFFRDAFSAYAIASDRNLRFLSRQLKNDRFIPSHASKHYTPKPSGILRCQSLLTTNDQIAFQAAVNVVAEALHKSTKRRYRTIVFNHLYAGKSSIFFYLKWEDSYRAFGDAIRRNFNAGFKYVATFDLTAFYDSIDHHVLRVMLQRTSVDPDTIEFLLICLRQWTSSTWSSGYGQVIHHEHGIPQGPLSSGMLSEVVLQYLDRAAERPSKDVRYIRYVDDIKLMARDEKTLRRRLVRLDIAAKEIGLFPQASKISIREIQDPEEEVKSVSIPSEPAANPFATQEEIARRIRELASRGRPSDGTRFRYALHFLKPSHKTNNILLKTWRLSPEFSDAISQHFSKYRTLPRSVARQLIDLVTTEGVYHSVNADILSTLYGRIAANEDVEVANFSYERLYSRKYRKATFPTPQPAYKVQLLRWALRSANMNFDHVMDVVRLERDWWVKQQFLSLLDDAKFGRPSYEALINVGMTSAEPEPARVSAAIAFENGLTVTVPGPEIHWTARILLRVTNLIRYAGRPPSLVNDIISYTLARKRTPYDWQKYFGTDHASAEKMAILAKQRFETDIDAFCVVLDSFCDQVLRTLYVKRGHVMSTSYGNAVGAGSPAWLIADFPKLKDAFYRLHALRIRSFTAHPKHLATGAPNTRIRHRAFSKIRKPLSDAFDELEGKVPV